MSLGRAKYFLLGFLLGLVIPLLILLMEIVAGFNPVISGKKNVLYLIALALNMILLRVTFRRFNEHTIKGLTLSIFISALAIFNFRFPR